MSIQKSLLGLAAAFVVSGPCLAYDLASCTPTQNWVPIYGKCDGGGKLQGSGGALYFGMFVKGQFKDGLPDGKHDFLFADLMQQRSLLQAKNENITTLESYGRDQPLPKYSFFCGIHFKDGQVIAQEIKCETTYGSFNYDKLVSYVIKPFDGKIRIETQDGAAKLVAEMPDIAISRKFGGGVDGFFDSPKNVTMIGTADRVEFGLFSVAGSKQSVLRISGAVAEISSDNPQHPTKIRGYFNASCNAAYSYSCRADLVEYKAKPGPVDKRYLTTLEASGSKYQFVMLGISSVYYFKGPDGVEFDGSTGPCPVGRAALVESSRNNTTVWDIRPECGKITTPDGRSFTGKFDRDGRPVTN